MGPSKVLTFLPPQIQNFWQLSLLELHPYLKHCDFFLGLIWSVYLHCTIWSSLLMLHSHPTLVFKPAISLLSILYLLLPSHHHPLLLLLPLPLTPSGFFNGMLAFFKPGALNCFTFFCSTSSTLSASRNPILIHLPLSGFLDSLLYVLIAPTPGLAFSLVMPRALVVASSFSSGRLISF